MRQITVVAAVIEWDSKILCMQRGDNGHVYTSFHWEFPGGKIEPGETPQQALHRELLEEMDLEVEVGEHIHTQHHVYPDFEITLMFYHCTPCNAIAGEMPAFERREHNDHRWLAPCDLHTLDWCEADYPVIEILADR